MKSLHRKIIQVNLVRIPPQLKELTSRIPEHSVCHERHGRLLSLVNTNIEEDMIKVLFQFFDPPYTTVLHSLIINWCLLWRNFLNF